MKNFYTTLIGIAILGAIFLLVYVTCFDCITKIKY